MPTSGSREQLTSPFPSPWPFADTSTDSTTRTFRVFDNGASATRTDALLSHEETPELETGVSIDHQGDVSVYPWCIWRLL